MELFSAHKMRQSEQSTWLWTERPTGNNHRNQEADQEAQENEVLEEGVNNNFCRGIAASTTAGCTHSSPSPPEEATQNHQQQQEEVRPCCCETLENALVTIDILRSKLVCPIH